MIGIAQGKGFPRKCVPQIFHSICRVGVERLGDRGVEGAGAYEVERLRACVDADVVDVASLAYLGVAPACFSTFRVGDKA